MPCEHISATARERMNKFCRKLERMNKIKKQMRVVNGSEKTRACDITLAVKCN